MVYLNIPEDKNRLLSFYLATEEYVANKFDDKEYFFMWQVYPTVIFGRNQLIENEVNLEYCRTHNIRTFRRKSGGGCVYADMSNVMLSYITDENNVNFTFNKYINMIVLMLRKLGVNATASGRNDIMIDGRKVSGNAFYHTPRRNIVHGTMLYDTDMQVQMPILRYIPALLTPLKFRSEFLYLHPGLCRSRISTHISNYHVVRSPQIPDNNLSPHQNFSF